MDKPVALGEVTLGEGVDSWNTIIFLYNSALKEVRTKVEILNDEFQQVHQYNPIEYIKSRIKAPESIVKKLKRYGYDSSIDNMVNYINDIAGIRIVCSFTSDIYRLAEMIGKQNDLTVISVKDYIRHPKESGYKSYHMLVTVPIFLSDCIIDTKVEIQIRTMAMDFWASLEHTAPIITKNKRKSISLLIADTGYHYPCTSLPAPLQRCSGNGSPKRTVFFRRYS